MDRPSTEAAPSAPALALPPTQVPAASLAAERSAVASQTTGVVPEPAQYAALRITAVGGNLFIRRGPHLAFNPLDVLHDGDSLPATGRDALAHWVRVAFPGKPASAGWVSIQTRFSSLDGDPMELEVVSTDDWPAGASIRNCTDHDMLVRPSETILLDSEHFPDNEAALYPGEYAAYDLDIEGAPEALSFSLREGLVVEIIEDGTGERTKCD
jgi:hypothetical protein